jgi:hypothetical protein
MSTSVSDLDLDEQVQGVCAGERAAVYDLVDQPAFRAALIRTAPDRHRFVLTTSRFNCLVSLSIPVSPRCRESFG